jgi:RNA recognition motif-containing protein
MSNIPEVWKIMPKLFLTNIPHDCSELQLRQWIESRGIETAAIRVVRDIVAGVSPSFGYVELKDKTRVMDAVSMLNGKQIGSRTIQVQATVSTIDRRTA